MSDKGVCELCGFADDSYRIDENGTVLKVCKFCHDGYLERMGLPPDADKPIEDIALTLDIDEIRKAGIDTEGMSGEELLQLEMELAERKKTKVPTLDEKELVTLLETTEDDKKVLTGVRQKEMRRKKKAMLAGEDESGEDYKASEELIRSGEELQRVVEGLQKIAEGLPEDDREEEAEAPLIAKIVAPKAESEPPPQESRAAEKSVANENATSGTAVSDVEEKEEPKESEQESESEKPREEIIMKEKTPKTEDRAERLLKEARAREKIHEAANQKIDDERIKITSPEVALSKDTRPKTNLDVAISEYSGGVRFLDAFKYVMHKVSYAVFLGIIVLAVSTVMFIRDSWEHGLIVLAGGVGAVVLGFLLMWYLSHCYETDRRALLLRIRQQEILFESMNSDCYRELRTKFTIIKALGWLLNKLSVLLPLIVVVGGNIAAVIASFLSYYYMYPIISAAASVGGVLIYYITKFQADCVAYVLDRERNQQIQQQTLLDILDRLKK